ncbi:CU044_5270 family protein [Amycolatopsis sp. NPDC051128]|uniref:CU044_5270 family protein n=1 Tax=Amycolatopsis sp. NPDC051128 TaxID=3155412 RepID=UPI00343C166B
MTDDNNIRQIWSDAELDAALADLHGDPGPDDGLAFARTALLTAAGAPPEEAPAPRKSHGSWRWIAVAAAVATLTGGLFVATRVPGQEPAVVSPAAPGLDQLRGTDLPVRPGEYRHMTTSMWSTITNDKRVSGYFGTLTELWIPADPGGIWHRRSQTTNELPGLPVPQPRYEPKPVKKSDEAGAGGLFPIVRIQYPDSSFPGTWDAPTADFVARLPVDVQQLRDQLVNTQGAMGKAVHPGKPNGPGRSAEMVQHVMELGLAPGKLRVALWQALARVDGIVTKPGTVAPDGRVGIGFTAQDTGDTLIADPETAQLIGHTIPPKSAKGGGPSSAVITPLNTPVSSTVESAPRSAQTSPPKSESMATATTEAPSTGPEQYSLVESYTYSVTTSDR